MRVRFDSPEFDPTTYDFHTDPILIIDNFFTPADRATIINRMRKVDWHDAPPRLTDVLNQSWRGAFVPKEEHSIISAQLFQWPCISKYIGKKDDHYTDLTYYRYRTGDYLAKHDDFSYYDSSGVTSITWSTTERKLSIVGYVHNRWQDDWGGELVMYRDGEEKQIITPEPGRLVLFTVPFVHEVIPVARREDTELARLSISGWIMRKPL